MQANAVRLQLHALEYNLANFFRTLVMPDGIERWSPTTLREKIVKIGAKVITYARYVTFQMAEVAVAPDLFRRILEIIEDLRPRQAAMLNPHLQGGTVEPDGRGAPDMPVMNIRGAIGRVWGRFRPQNSFLVLVRNGRQGHPAPESAAGSVLVGAISALAIIACSGPLAPLSYATSHYGKSRQRDLPTSSLLCSLLDF